jgi:hydrogenase maturation factor
MSFACSDPYHCITCGDSAVLMTVVAVDVERDLALCADDDGGRHSVQTALVEPVEVGGRLLVHAGTALTVVGDGT